MGSIGVRSRQLGQYPNGLTYRFVVRDLLLIEGQSVAKRFRPILFRDRPYRNFVFHAMHLLGESNVASNARELDENDVRCWACEAEHLSLNCQTSSRSGLLLMARLASLAGGSSAPVTFFK